MGGHSPKIYQEKVHGVGSKMQQHQLRGSNKSVERASNSATATTKIEPAAQHQQRKRASGSATPNAKSQWLSNSKGKELAAQQQQRDRASGSATAKG